MKRLQKASWSLVGLMCLSGSAVLAHPGHGTPSQEQTIWHYLLEPEHLFPIFAAVLIAGAIAWGKATRDHHSDS